MKVLHLLTTDTFSGAENVVCQIINMMKGDVEAVYCSPDGKIRQSLQERDVPFLPLKEFSTREVKRAIREFNPDVIHAHDMKASFVAFRACGKTPFVSHVHNNAFDSRKLSLKSIAYYFSARKAKHIFWVSNSAFNGYKFHAKFENKSSVLYNVIDVDALYKRRDQDTNSYPYDVVYVGRLAYQKNPERLVRVIKMAVEKLPTIKFAIVGRGDLEDEVKLLIEKEKLQENVEMLGFMSNPLKIMSDAKAMIMTSRWEGTPMCVLEAMALGLPIVSTPVDGLNDLVFDGKNGYLSDDDQEIADNLIRIVTNQNLYLKMSSFIKDQAIELNDLEKYKKKIIDSYK